MGLYFSASWCPPCRTFTPKLVEFHKANKDKFEVLLVSADNSSKAQANYMHKDGRGDLDSMGDKAFLKWTNIQVEKVGR